MKQTVKLLAIASSFAFLANVANADTFIKMVSGPSGGSWYPLGAKIMQTFQAKLKELQLPIHLEEESLT